MAAVTHEVTVASTTGAATYATGAFTPALNDLLIAFAFLADTVTLPTMTDSLGGAWTRVLDATRSSEDDLYLFVRNTLVTADSMTVTVDVTGDNGAGCFIFVAAVAGMTRTGSSAVRQLARQEEQAGGATPAPVFASAVLTGNPTLGCIVNATNPIIMVEPTGWTEQAETGFDTPGAGGEYVSRDSGFTGTTITWGSLYVSSGAVIIVELDTSAVAVSTGGLTLLGVG